MALHTPRRLRATIGAAEGAAPVRRGGLVDVRFAEARRRARKESGSAEATMATFEEAIQNLPEDRREKVLRKLDKIQDLRKESERIATDDAASRRARANATVS